MRTRCLLVVHFALVNLVSAAMLAALAIWTPRPTPVRLGALIVAALFLPLTYVQSLEMPSRPKPTSFEWFKRSQDTVQVLSVSFDEGNNIYLWLHMPHSVEPRAYVIPWNLRLAEKLEDAVDDAARKNSTILPPPLPPMPPKVFNPRKGDSI